MSAALRRGCAAALATALLVPAGALAESADSGPSKRGFEVFVSIAYDGNKPEEIRKFRFENIIVECDSGGPPNPFTTDSLPPHFGPMSVDGHGRFDRVFSNNGNKFDGKVIIRGRFLTRRKLEGTLKIKGDYPNAGYEGCTSGRVEWAAELA